MTTEPKITLEDLPEYLRDLTPEELFQKAWRTIKHKDMLGLSNETAVQVLRYLTQLEQPYPKTKKNSDNKHFEDEGAFQNFMRVSDSLKELAESKNDRAQYGLGTCYYFGLGVSKNFEKAFEWFEKSAEQGNAHAQYLTARLYYWGEGVEQDTAKALEWCQKSSDQGNLYAHRMLGNSYRNGFNIEQDKIKGLRFLFLASVNDDKPDQGGPNSFLNPNNPENTRILPPIASAFRNAGVKLSMNQVDKIFEPLMPALKQELGLG